MEARGALVVVMVLAMALYGLHHRAVFFSISPPFFIYARQPGSTMHNLVVFSLYNSVVKMNVGAIRNAQDVPFVYPGFRARFYIDHSVNPAVVQQLRKHGAEVIAVNPTSVLFNASGRMMWRFMAIDDPSADVVLLRDVDSRISLREVAAVNQWLLSKKSLHIMRDHPAHVMPIMGGMWGVRAPAFQAKLNITAAALRMMTLRPEGNYNLDQEMLAQVVWPVFQIDSVQHDAFHCERLGGSPFPTARYYDESFVGSRYFQDHTSEFGNMTQYSMKFKAIFGQQSPLKCRSDPAAIFG